MDRPYRTVRDLVHAHAGQPAVVLGGGLSLPHELKQCPERPEAVYLSANQHGALLVECDYLVAHDKIEGKLRGFGKPLISRHMWADYRIMDSIVPSTGVETAWIARLMGCTPIYITGMDCYTKGTYFHDPEALNIGHSLPTEEHLRRWRTTLTQYPADYRAMGGPLRTAVPEWDCVQRGIVARDRLIEEAAGMFVRFKHETPYRGRVFEAGCQAELPKKESLRLVELGHAARM